MTNRLLIGQAQCSPSPLAGNGCRSDLGRAVNKFRFIRHPAGVRVFAIGNQLHRLDLPNA